MLNLPICCGRFLGRTGWCAHIWLNNFAPVVVTARRTNAMRQHARTTMAAIDQLWHANGIMRPATISPTFAHFTFWQWCHNFTLLFNQNGLKPSLYHPKYSAIPIQVGPPIGDRQLCLLGSFLLWLDSLHVNGQPPSNRPLER